MSVTKPTSLGNIYQLSDGKLFEADTEAKLLEITEAPKQPDKPQEYIINGQSARLIKRQLWTKRITIIPGNTGFRLQLLASRLAREAVFFNSFNKVKKLSKKELEFKVKKEACSWLHLASDICLLCNAACELSNCLEYQKKKKRQSKKEVLPIPCEFQRWQLEDRTELKSALCSQTNTACLMETCPILLNDPEYQAKAKAKATRKPRVSRKAQTPMDDFQIANELEWLSEQGYCDSDLAFYQDLMLRGTYERP
jgi:hypothetical protein